MRHHPDCDVYRATLDKEANDFYGIFSKVDPDDYHCHCDNEVKEA